MKHHREKQEIALKNNLWNMEQKTILLSQININCSELLLVKGSSICLFLPPLNSTLFSNL